jgi:ribose 5-phosphate isomerase B
VTEGAPLSCSAEAVAAGQLERGVALCGSGVHKQSPERTHRVDSRQLLAAAGVEDDHINIICSGGRTACASVAWDLLEMFLNAEFSDAGRHLRRLATVKGREVQGGIHECAARSRSKNRR